MDETKPREALGGLLGYDREDLGYGRFSLVQSVPVVAWFALRFCLQHLH